MIETASSTLEISNNKGQADGKLFDTYYTMCKNPLAHFSWEYW